MHLKTKCATIDIHYVQHSNMHHLKKCALVLYEPLKKQMNL